MSVVNQKMVTELARVSARLKSKMENIRNKIEEKFEIDLTKEAINYAYLQFRDSINELLKKEIEKFQKIMIIIDYSKIIDELDFLLGALNETKKDLAGSLPDPNLVVLTPMDEIKRVKVSFPNDWNVSIVDKFRNSLIKKLGDQRIAPA